MKQQELSRAIKENLWRQFDKGAMPEAVMLDGKPANLNPAAVQKQFTLWSNFRKRNPLK